MEKSENNKNSLGIVIIVLVICLVVATTAFNLLLNNNEKESNAEVNVITGISNDNNANALSMDMEKLKTMHERDRMEYYFSYWLQLIETRKYEEAYEILYPEFKETYFNTLSQFKDYVQKTFPKMAGVTYTNIERNGDIYVLWVEITDALNGSKEDIVEINVVIKENDFANIELSFSLI